MTVKEIAIMGLEYFMDQQTAETLKNLHKFVEFLSKSIRVTTNPDGTFNVEACDKNNTNLPPNVINRAQAFVDNAQRLLDKTKPIHDAILQAEAIAAVENKLDTVEQELQEYQNLFNKLTP